MCGRQGIVGVGEKMGARLHDGGVGAHWMYKIHEVLEMMENWCANKVGGIYLEVRKDGVYTTEAYRLARR